MSNAPELLPCPFCGWTEIYIEPDERGSGGQWVLPIHVGCCLCGVNIMCVDAETEDAAAEVWNRRPAAPQQNVGGAPEAELMRQKAISNARERNAALRAIQAALDDFELIVDRINAGQINRACATAMQGAKEAKLALAATAAEDGR